MAGGRPGSVGNSLAGSRESEDTDAGSKESRQHMANTSHFSV